MLEESGMTKSVRQCLTERLVSRGESLMHVISLFHHIFIHNFSIYQQWGQKLNHFWNICIISINDFCLMKFVAMSFEFG